MGRNTISTTQALVELGGPLQRHPPLGGLVRVERVFRRRHACYAEDSDSATATHVSCYAEEPVPDDVSCYAEEPVPDDEDDDDELCFFFFFFFGFFCFPLAVGAGTAAGALDAGRGSPALNLM